MNASAPLNLQAGPLKMRLENGAIRSVKWGDTEIVRMIYGATRDPNWITLQPQIENERREIKPDSFVVEFNARYVRDEINFRAHTRIQGDSRGRIDFEFSGVAERDFEANRVGLCAHLPLDECVGKPVALTTGGRIEDTRFPEDISPYQPFRAVEALQWQPSPDCRASLHFEGEVFEAEDQRNWTDASFKIYGRPLELPFPFEMKAGEKVSQRITLIFEALTTGHETLVDAPISLSLSGETQPLPRLGLGATTDWTPTLYSDVQVAALRTLPISFLRGEVRLFESNWLEQCQRVRNEAQLLDWPLELVLWFGEDAEQELSRFLEFVEAEPIPVEAILLLKHDCKVTPDSFFEDLVPLLQKKWPTAKVGGGTDAFFTELNRNRPEAPFDFVAFSASPQVHAEDDFSIVENLAAQAHVVRSARSFWKGPLHVGPVTLRRRNNPDATTQMPTIFGELPWNVDVRQPTLFAAGWTLGSLKYLAESHADRVTFYEVAGMRGLLGAGEAPAPFSELNGQFFSLFFVFQELIRAQLIELSQSSAPLEIECLVVHGADNQRKIVIANLTGETKRVKPPFSQYRCRILDEVIYTAFADSPEGFLDCYASLEGEDVVLPPYALAILEEVST